MLVGRRRAHAHPQPLLCLCVQHLALPRLWRRLMRRMRLVPLPGRRGRLRDDGRWVRRQLVQLLRVVGGHLLEDEVLCVC